LNSLLACRPEEYKPKDYYKTIMERSANVPHEESKNEKEEVKDQNQE
jgi:hypothetical protein